MTENPVQSKQFFVFEKKGMSFKLKKFNYCGEPWIAGITQADPLKVAREMVVVKVAEIVVWKWNHWIWYEKFLWSHKNLLFTPTI